MPLVRAPATATLPPPRRELSHVVSTTTVSRSIRGYMSCLRRDRSDALIKPEGPGNSGTTANTAGCALPGSGLPVLPVAPRPTLHFRNGVSEHVLPQTAQTPSLSQRVPATQNKKPPCNNTWWTGVKRTVQRPPLCLHRECRLRHAPTVVAGSSMDCCCTGNKGTASGVKRRGADRATKEGKASGRSDRHCHLPSTPGGARGACDLQEEPGRVRVPVASYNKTPSSRNSGRRPSLPETNSMAGRTCVRNGVEVHRTPNAATTQNPQA